MQFRFPYLSSGSWRGLCLWVSALTSYVSLYSFFGLCNFRGKSLSCDLTSFGNLSGGVGFSICLAFYLVGQFGNLQTSYMLIGNWKSALIFFRGIFLNIEFWVDTFSPLFSILKILFRCLLTSVSFDDVRFY